MTGMSALEIAEGAEAAANPRSSERALSIVIRHERWLELERLRSWNKWLEHECRRNFHRGVYAQRRFEILRDAVVPSNSEVRVTIWRNAEGVHVMRSDSDIIGIL